jgi:hypothetical protein
MSDVKGKWLLLADYILASGKEEPEVLDLIREGDVLSKSVSGKEYIWIDDEQDKKEDISETPSSDKDSETGPEETVMEKESSPSSPVEGETLVSPMDSSQLLVLQTERSISLVERSLNTFMMMHKEVVNEKERFAQLSGSGIEERDNIISEKDQEIKSLKENIKEKEQEIADLRMLVDILEGQVQRTRPSSSDISLDEVINDKASVGDLMEDQLKYIMEDDMIKDLLK